MVRLVAVNLAQMDVEPPLNAHGTEELLQQLHLEVAHHEVLLPAGEHQKRTPAQIDRRLAERLVHGHGREPVARDTSPLAQRLVERLAKHEANVLHRVVVVHVQISHGLHRQIHERVLLQELQHVVEESDAGVYLARAGTVQVQRELDLRLLRVPFYLCSSHILFLSCDTQIIAQSFALCHFAVNSKTAES